MGYNYDQLSKMTVAQLREIAQGVDHDAVKGSSTMHKEKLLPALCHALGIEAKHHHEVVGIDKKKIKSEIRQLKIKRVEAIKNKNKIELKNVRDNIHKLKRLLRKNIV